MFSVIFRHNCQIAIKNKNPKKKKKEKERSKDDQMSLLDRVQRGIQVGLRAARGTTDLDLIGEQLDEMMADGSIEAYLLENEEAKELKKKNKSFLSVRRTSQNVLGLYSMLVRSVGKNELPPPGDPTRDIVLAEFWKKEPILAGAVYSMSAKMTALSWTVIGQSEDANYYAQLLSRSASMEGYDWGAFISASAQDFYTTDRGVFWETPRDDHRLYGRIADLGHIDALQCAMTGNTKRPIFYLSDVTGQHRFFKPGEFIHYSSMPSPRELHFGTGTCASSRAYRAAKLLMGLHDYDSEKLANLPPEGVASVSGLTMDEFQDALALWRASREKNRSLTFPQVLWLVGSQPNATIGVDFVGFSQIPESFDRSTVIEQYVNTLALVFGVDAREFWPISTSSLGTASESEIQHMKAKGKGPGEFVSIVERKINGELPEGVEFSFDTQDIAEDKQAADIAKTWVEALLPLVTGGSPGGPQAGESPPKAENEGEGRGSGLSLKPAGANPQVPGGSPAGFITPDEFLRLLADRGVLPNYLVKDKRVVITDSGISEKEAIVDDFVVYRWKEGVLSVERLPEYTVISPYGEPEEPLLALPAETITQPESDEGVLSWLKQLEEEILEGHRGIRGKPIPTKEALRGNKVTQAAVKVELERWRNHPILSQYVPTEAEGDQEILETLSGR